jgi:hypothetical protein
MEQMMERLLEKMDANQAEMKAVQEQMDTNQAKAEADGEVLKGIMDANTKSIREDIKSGQAEVRSIVRVFREKMYACVTSRRDREVTMSCQEKMGQNSGEKEAVVERQKIPNEEVAIHSLRACRARQQPPKKRRRLSPIQGRCSPWRSIKKSPRNKPQ